MTNEVFSFVLILLSSFNDSHDVNRIYFETIFFEMILDRETLPINNIIDNNKLTRFFLFYEFVPAKNVNDK